MTTARDEIEIWHELPTPIDPDRRKSPVLRCATLCYMKSSVGVRELRQNLSQYLRRVEQGETLEVLERGRPVAVLAPLPERRGALERLKASGRVIPARLSLADLGPPPDSPPGVSLSQALSDLRSEER